MEGLIRTMVLLEGGDSKMVVMGPEMIAQLATSISENGVEHLTISKQETITVVGFMVIGKKTGERVIVLPKAPVTTESPSDSGSRKGSGGSHE
jgi:hypothetical protein